MVLPFRSEETVWVVKQKVLENVKKVNFENFLTFSFDVGIKIFAFSLDLVYMIDNKSLI